MNDSPGRNAWQVEVHDRIEPLETCWRALEAQGCCTLFQTYDWLAVWYEVTSRHGMAEPVIVTATRVGGDAPDVIFPLCRTRRRGISMITFADILVSDFTAPVFAPDACGGERAVRDLWSAVRAALPRCDVIHLDKLCEKVGSRPNPLLNLDGMVERPEGAWGLSLADTKPGELPASIHRQNAKKTIKRAERMAREHDRRYEWHQDRDRLPALFEELVALRLHRFEVLNREELLEDAAWMDFYRTIVARDHDSIEVVIATIVADGQTVAAGLGFVHQGALHYIMPSFLTGDEWNRHAPGLQLVIDMIRECPARDISYFDLTIGDEPYKKSVGACRRPLLQAFIPVTALGWAAYALWRLRYEVRRRPRVAAVARKLLMRPEPA